MGEPNLLALFSPKNIIIFMMIFTRLTGMITTAPFFSTFEMPLQIRIWFCALVSFILYPILSAKAGFILPNTMPEFAILLTIEFAIGFLIGFVANLLFVGAQMVGEIISIQMGLSMASVLDPATGEATPVIGNFYNYLVAIVFLVSGAYQYLFGAVYKSFFALPVGLENIVTPAMAQGILTMSAQVFKIAFGLAMPIFSVLLVCDILLGMMSKVMPQMNIFMVSLPFKICLGLVLILFFLHGSMSYLYDVTMQYMEAILRLFT